MDCSPTTFFFIINWIVKKLYGVLGSMLKKFCKILCFMPQHKCKHVCIQKKLIEGIKRAFVSRERIPFY